MSTQQRVRKLLSYRAGRLYWRVSMNSRAQRGKEAGFVAGHYRRIGIEGRVYLLHQIVFLWWRGYIPKQLDHKNRNKLDNRISNLRAATTMQNAWNRSDAVGGYFCKRREKWRALICVRGKRVELGHYETKEEAHQVYLKAKRKHHAHVSTPKT